MLTIETSIELPIAHSLQGAYQSLCVGNVSRDNHTIFDLTQGLLPIIHGHNYVVTITIGVEEGEMNKDGMVMDFKKMKEEIKKFFDKYDHSMILQKDNPLVKVYEKNYKDRGIKLEDTRLFIWDENPTAENMAIRWTRDLQEIFQPPMIVSISVEETSHNKVKYISDEICLM